MENILEHHGEKYLLINQEDIILDEMTPVQKVTSIFAVQVPEGRSFEVMTYNHSIVETKNIANEGDWIVYNIGASHSQNIDDKLTDCDRKVITDENFHKLYTIRDEESDGSTYSDYDETLRMNQYDYTGREVFVAQVPYNFALKAPWGELQFIKKFGYIIYNPHLSSEDNKEIYGTSGAIDGKAGQFSKTYSLSKDGNNAPMCDIHKFLIRINRSPIAGIQLTESAIEMANERIHSKDGSYNKEHEKQHGTYYGA